jgi:L-threonylcarbamoyladenylate synthase
MKEMLTEAVKTLHMGQVVAHPTETCYGLAADIFQKAAVERVYRLKGMPFGKPVSILVKDLDDAQQYGEFSVEAVKLALKHWPGPLTIVVPRKSSLPIWINPGMDTVGFRVSSNKKARQLVETFGGPLTTTSANVTGEESPYSVQEVLEGVGESGRGLVPDFVLDGGQIGKELPSTIVKVVGKEVEVLRQGSVVFGVGI